MIPYEKEFSNTIAIEKNGDKDTFYVPITSELQDNYSPFTQVIAFNGTKTKTVKLILDHDDTRSYTLRPGEKINITGILYSQVKIQNLDADNSIAIGDLKVRVRNYE